MAPVKDSSDSFLFHISALAGQRALIVIADKSGTVKQEGRFCFVIPVRDITIFIDVFFCKFVIIRTIAAAFFCILQKTVITIFDILPFSG